MLEITKTRASPLVRGMLLEWVSGKLHIPGVVRGGECGVHCAGVCANAAATWFNTANRAFLCEPCAKHLNERYLVCVPATNDHQPAIDVAKLRAMVVDLCERERTKKEKSEDELLDDLKAAAGAYIDCVRSKNNGSGKKTGFDRVLERFAVDE